MDKIHINLLPKELELSSQDQKKRKLIFRSSIGILSLIVVASGLVLGYRISQEVNLKSEVQKVETIKAEIPKYKDQEVTALELKNRADSVLKLENIPQDVPLSYILINSLTPPSVRLLSYTVDKTGSIKVNGETFLTSELQKFFDNLTNQKMHQGKIEGVTVESLGLNAGSAIKFDLDIKLSGVSDGKVKSKTQK